jgi:hypothetical protein
MTVHVGEITSEVSVGADEAAEDATGGADEWEERLRTAAVIERIERDRSRTTTGYGDD